MFTGAWFCKAGEITTPICDLKPGIIGTIFADEAEAIEDELPFETPKKNTDLQYSKQPDLYIADKIENIVAYVDRMSRHTRKQIQQHITPLTMFKSWRAILDMDSFVDFRNTRVFWKDYIRQLWDQSGQQEREKLWMTLNDIIHYHSKGRLTHR